MTTLEGQIQEAPLPSLSPDFPEFDINFVDTPSPPNVSYETVIKLNSAVKELGRKALECVGLSVDTEWSYLIVKSEPEHNFIGRLSVDKANEESYVIHYDRQEKDNPTSGYHTEVRISPNCTGSATHSTLMGKHETFGDKPVEHLMEKFDDLACGHDEIRVYKNGQLLNPAA